MAFTKKSDIEAEFNAGVTYAETVAILFRKASDLIVDIKATQNSADLSKLIAILKEIWMYGYPYSRYKNLEELEKLLKSLEDKALKKSVKNRSDLIEFINKVDELKLKIHVYAVYSGLIPYRARISDSQKLKRALL